MAGGDYEQAYAGGGGLKLKGAGEKKKKKKSSTSAKEKLKAEAIAERSGSRSVSPQGGGNAPGSASTSTSTAKLDGIPTRTEKTAAEIRFAEIQKKRLADKVKKQAVKTHKDRVAEFNQHLESLSEHYDIPKVGPG